jgi:hypothetical protein
MLEFFIYLMLELLELFSNFYSLRVTFFLKIYDLKVLAIFLLFTFFLEFALYFPFFPQQKLPSYENSKLKKMLVMGEEGK